MLMRRRMIYTTKFISVLVFIALMLAACNKDEWKDDVDALKQPMPTGIVIMDAVSVTAVKGTIISFAFRVNPSGVAVTEGNLELDIAEQRHLPARTTYSKCLLCPVADLLRYPVRLL